AGAGEGEDRGGRAGAPGVGGPAPARRSLDPAGQGLLKRNGVRLHPHGSSVVAPSDPGGLICSRAMAEAPNSRIFAPGLLDGKICVVSGAGTGLGKATALELARLGATVVGCGRRTEPLEEMVAEVKEGGGKAEFE